MIFRCTAQFLQGFDQLDARHRAVALRTLEGFKTNARIPSASARPLSTRLPKRETDDVWAATSADGSIIFTYNIMTEPAQDQHFICVLRHIGLVPARPAAGL